MHGEYKVVGGKLVVVDLKVEDARLADVQVAGDFFLEPEDALIDIRAALNGLSVHASAEEIAQAVRSGLRADAAMIGFTPEAVAIAVRRALGVATTWRDYEWQIVQTEPLSPAMHIALDVVLSQRVAAGLRAPTLRFWEWERPAIIIGNFQSLKNEVDMQAVEQHGVTVVRRVTGGGAMFVEPGAGVTYSLYAPGGLVGDMSFADSYAFLDNWVLQGLKKIGVDAYYKPLNDITSPKGKIGGAAQKRFAKGTVLHHVTMSYDMDAQKMTEVLRIGREKLSDKGTTSAVKRVDPLRSQTGMAREDIVESLKNTFVELNGGAPGSISDEEYAEAEKLVAEKFMTKEWLHHIP